MTQAAAQVDTQSQNKWLVAIVVSLATFMEVLDTTITNVSLRHIAGSLGAGQEESTWILTSYLVANGIILPLSGWLSDVLGRKRFFIFCIIGFTAASFACGAATSLVGLIIFRIIQGAAGGGLQPTQQAIILDKFPPSERGAVFAITGLTMIVAPIIGPTLGGIITDNIDWRWIFYINIPVGLTSAFLVWRMVDDPPHAKAKGFKKIDFIGLGLVSLGLAALQIVLDKGQQEDWFASAFIQNWGVISLICLSIAAIWLWKKDEAIIDLSLLTNLSFASSCLLIFLVGFALYSSSALLPLLLQTEFGYNATLAGLILSPGGLAVVFLMPIAGRLIGKVQARYLIMVGLALCTFGMYYSMHFNPQTDFDTFKWMRVTQVLGLPFLFIPISTLAFANIPKEKSSKASALFALFRNVGGSVGIAVAAAHVSHSQQLHQHALASHLVPGNSVYEKLISDTQKIIPSMDGTMAHINRTLQQQSNQLAYADTFEFMAVLMGCALVLSIFVLPANKPGQGPASSGH
ncbi:MAG: DHA2 family efflux MFS transporter permease subunit [Alphaproteobacteria bacterium]|nr:DHA2 family efflux MFS transporter permease subunit [Alphaproteobacteria bacterium]